MSERQYAEGKLRTPQELAQEARAWGCDLPSVLASPGSPWPVLGIAIPVALLPQALRVFRLAVEGVVPEGRSPDARACRPVRLSRSWRR